MSLYLDMWNKIHESTPAEREAFLRAHPRALGVNLEFKGAVFFDVDLLEAIRNHQERR